jgi:enoyl-CoA hydratase/carnithine racemase
MEEIRYEVAARVATLPIDRPVVCAVDGMTVGMGAEFATRADIRLVSRRARFRWN